MAVAAVGGCVGLADALSMYMLACSLLISPAYIGHTTCGVNCVLSQPVQANKHFDKEAALREAENVVKAKQAAYNKDDFFDMMSCETLDKMGHAQAPDGMHNRRSMQVRLGAELGLGWSASAPNFRWSRG
jgi:hypothetical protein